MKKILLAISAITLSVAANAQGTYVVVDVNPDQVINTSDNLQFNIDLNTDGITDASFVAALVPYGGTDYDFTQFNCGSNSADNAVVGSTGTVALAAQLPAGTIIGSDEANFPGGATWVDTVEAAGTAYTTSLAAMGTSLAGSWANGDDAYIGLRFNAATGTHYAWLLANISADGKVVTVKAYAYNTTPDEHIVAGATSNVGLNELSQNNWTVVTSGKTVTVNTTYEGEVSVVDAAGTVVAKGTVANGTLSVDLKNATAGMYFVSLNQNGAVATKKIVLQ